MATRSSPNRNALVRFFVIASISLRGVASLAAESTELEPLRVELSAPATCPSTPSLFDRVHARTSRVRRAEPGEPARSLVVRVVPSATGFVAHLKLGGDGEDYDELERRVPGKTCSEVLAAVALITALTIDPLAAGVVPNDEGEKPPPAPVVDAAADVPDVALPPPPTLHVEPAGPPARGATFRVSVGTSLDAYGLGELVLGESLWVEGGIRSSLEPALRLRLARSQSFTADPDGRPAFFRRNTGALEGCVTALGSHARAQGGRVLALRPCLDVAVGAIDASSAAYGPALHERRAWASLGGLLEGRWLVVGPLSLEAAFGLTMPLIRDDFFFRPQLPVYRVPAVMLVGNVGVGLTFP